MEPSRAMHRRLSKRTRRSANSPDCPQPREIPITPLYFKISKRNFERVVQKFFKINFCNRLIPLLFLPREIISYLTGLRGETLSELRATRIS